MGDLLSQMHGLNIRDSTYTILHAQLRRRWPTIANDYPKPELVSATPQPATYSYQAPPAAPNPNTSPQWSRTPAPTTSTPSFDDPNLFFRTRQRSEGCAFCNQNGHHIRKCNLAEEYVRSGRASIRGGRIHLLNGEPVPNDGTGRGIQAGIDSWLAGRPTSTSATPPSFAAPARDPPQHASLISTSRIEEIADSYTFQVAGASSPNLLTELDTDSSDSDTDTPDIFRVFAAEKKKRAHKPSRLPEATPPKKPSTTKPAEAGNLMPQVESPTQVDPPKPPSQTRSCSPAPSDLPKPNPPFDPHKPAPQYRYQSNAEDQRLIDELVSSLWQGNLAQVTPAHLYAASPAVRKEISEHLRVRRVEVTSYGEAPNSAPFTAESPPSAEPHLTHYPEPEYSLPLQEIDINLGEGISEPGLLDPSSQIVVIRRDLAQEINARVSPGLRIEMEGANGYTNWTLGCAEFLQMRVGDVSFKLHAHVVERAPFRLLLGRPFQRQLLCHLEDLPDGTVEVSVRDPRDISRRVYVPSRPRKIHVATLRVSSYSIDHSFPLADPILESSAALDACSEPLDHTTIDSPVGPLQFAWILQGWADTIATDAPSEPPDLVTIESPIGPLQFARTPQGWADDIATAPLSSPNSLGDLSPYLEDDAVPVTRDHDCEGLATREPDATRADALRVSSYSYSLMSLSFPPSRLAYQVALTNTPSLQHHEASLVYKKVAKKVRPVPTTLPEDFRNIRRIPEDPLLSLPPLPTHPPDFSPGQHLTEERLEALELNRFDFLWPEELKLLQHVLLLNETGLAWTDEERGWFRDEYFSPVKIPVIEHVPWAHKNIPIPYGILDEVIQIFKDKIAAGVYKPSDASYRSPFFCVKKKSGALRLVHDLQPLNAVTVRNSGVPPLTDQIIESMGGRVCYAVLDLFVGYDHRTLDVASRDLTTVQSPVGAV